MNVKNNGRSLFKKQVEIIDKQIAKSKSSISSAPIILKGVKVIPTYTTMELSF